jgi:hypothetical protein
MLDMVTNANVNVMSTLFICCSHLVVVSYTMQQYVTKGEKILHSLWSTKSQSLTITSM